MDKKLIFLIFWFSIITCLCMISLYNCILTIRNKYKESENVNKIQVKPSDKRRNAFDGLP